MDLSSGLQSLESPESSSYTLLIKLVMSRDFFFLSLWWIGKVDLQWMHLCLCDTGMSRLAAEYRWLLNMQIQVVAVGHADCNRGS